MNERLSSVAVPVYKLFPLIPAFSLTITAPYLNANLLKKEDLPAFLFLLGWGAIFYFVSRKWRIVYLDGDTLLVYRFLKRIRIPTSEICEVHASSLWGWQPRTITAKLTSETELGDEIVWVPRGFGYFAGREADRLKALFKLD